MDWFIRRENVKHYHKLLDETNDEERRKQINKLLAEEEQKQIEAGDFNSVKQAS